MLPFPQRLASLYTALDEFLNADYFLINNPADIFYLTGVWEDEAYAFVDIKKHIFSVVCDPRLTDSFRSKIAEEYIIEYRKWDEWLAHYAGKTFLIEGQSTTLAQAKNLQNQGIQICIMDESPFLDLRLYKDSDEFAAIQEACEVTDRAYSYIHGCLETGMSEKYVARLLRDFFESCGEYSFSFPPIVAFGQHTRSPHHQNTDKILEMNMPVLLDFGCFTHHYASDMTRSFWFGDTMDPQYEEDYQHLLAVQTQAIRDFQIGGILSDLEKNVRSALQHYNLDQYFTHSLGHSVGIEIHDGIGIARSDARISPGMVVTLEPGIYRSEYGIRIEDTIGIHPEYLKAIVLTQSSKTLH